MLRHNTSLQKLVTAFVFTLFFCITAATFHTFAQEDTQENLPLETQSDNQNSATDSAQQETIVTQTINLTVSPISINVETDPGATTATTMRIRNNAEEPEQLKLSLATFSADATGSAPVFREFTPDEEFQYWVSFSEDEFVVNPGEWKQVEVFFSPPTDAALGYYYAILVERAAEVSVEEGQTKIAGVPAILLLASVRSPLAQKQLELVSFASVKRVYEYLPSEFEIKIKNSGNIQTMPSGNIFIDSVKNNDIGIISINPMRGTILPDSTRTFTVNWDEGFPVYKTATDEVGNKSKELSWDFSKAHLFRMGKYTATLLFVYDNGERDIPLEATVSFWVIPWRLILAAVVVLSLTLIGIFTPVLLFWRRATKK